MLRTKGETGAFATATRALKMVQQLTRLINVEFKYFETDLSAQATSSGNMQNICYPTQGVSVNQREGDSIRMKTAQLTGEITFASPNNGPEVVRIIMFIDKQGTIASGSDLLENVPSGSAVRSNLNQNNKNDVIILSDESYALDQYHPIVLFNVHLPVEMHQQFVA